MKFYFKIFVDKIKTIIFYWVYIQFLILASLVNRLLAKKEKTSKKANLDPSNTKIDTVSSQSPQIKTSSFAKKK